MEHLYKVEEQVHKVGAISMGQYTKRLLHFIRLTEDEAATIRECSGYDVILTKLEKKIL